MITIFFTNHDHFCLFNSKSNNCQSIKIGENIHISIKKYIIEEKKTNIAFEKLNEGSSGIKIKKVYISTINLQIYNCIDACS